MRGAKLPRFWPWLAAILSGLLCTGCFAPFDQGWLCWIALTPLLTAVWFSGEKSKRRGRRDLALGFVAGCAFFLTAFFWLTTVTGPGWFLVSLYMATYYAIFGWFCGIVRPIFNSIPLALGEALNARRHFPWLNSFHNLGLALVVAAAWVTHEWLRGWVITGFPWNGLGVALHRNWPLIQIAEFTGMAGCSFLVAFANVILVASVRRFAIETRIKPVRPHYDVTLTLLLLLGVFMFGIHAPQRKRVTTDLRVVAVQANIAREEKFNPDYAQKIFDQFTRLTVMGTEAIGTPDLVVWPESSMPAPVLQNQETFDFVTGIAARLKLNLLLGVIDDNGRDAWNAALLVSPDDTEVQIYRKMHLVPFGEYIPGRRYIPLLARIVGDQVPGDFAVGHDPTVFHLTNSKVLVAPLICFEDTIGELARLFVVRGADLLANVTNDGWFVKSAASQQQLANAIFRCIELRRPMVRAANTGVTCYVNEFGRVTQVLLDEQGSQFTDGVLTSTVAVPTDKLLTFYARHGELFARICTAISILVACAAFWRRHFAKRVVSQQRTV